MPVLNLPRFSRAVAWWRVRVLWRRLCRFAIESEIAQALGIGLTLFFASWALLTLLLVL